MYGNVQINNSFINAHCTPLRRNSNDRHLPFVGKSESSQSNTPGDDLPVRSALCIVTLSNPVSVVIHTVRNSIPIGSCTSRLGSSRIVGALSYKQEMHMQYKNIFSP